MKLGTFSTDFSKNTQISNFMKIRPVGVELFQWDRLTDTHTNTHTNTHTYTHTHTQTHTHTHTHTLMKLTVALRNSENAPRYSQLIR